MLLQFWWVGGGLGGGTIVHRESKFNSYCSDGVLYGPLHSEAAVKNYEQAISDAKAQGGTIVYGGKVRWLLNFDNVAIVIQFMYTNDVLFFVVEN